MSLGKIVRRVNDAAWRLVYRIGFPIARRWWHLRQQPHEGALVAVYVGPYLLLLRSSYRHEWGLPGGGVKRGETPEHAARRELREEVGLGAEELSLPHVVCGIWDGRPDRVHVYELQLDSLPILTLDNRETVAARLFPPDQLQDLPITGPTMAYLVKAGRLVTSGRTFLYQP